MQVLPWFLDIGVTMLIFAVLIAVMGHILFGDFEVTMVTLSSSVSGAPCTAPATCPVLLAHTSACVLDVLVNTHVHIYTAPCLCLCRCKKCMFTHMYIYTQRHVFACADATSAFEIALHDSRYRPVSYQAVAHVGLPERYCSCSAWPFRRMHLLRCVI